MTYLNMGKLDIALDIFKGLLSEPPSHRNHGMALVNALHILNSSGRYAEAIELYNQHKVAASYVDPSIGLPYLLANRGMAYAGLGDYKDAYELMERAMAMTDSLRISLDYREGDFVIMLREKDVTLQHLKKNLSKFRVVIWIVAGLLLVAVVAFVGIWRRWRHANKTCTRLTMEAEENREKNVNTTADFLRLARVNESMEQIDSIYREKRVSDREKLERIGKQLDNVSLLENSWEVFRHNFEGAHSGFFRILKDNHPDLTQSEMRMCAYVVMQLSSKEIAALTGRTVRSVESMRYRIQKKLDVSGKDSLVEYLLSTTRAGK